jgi:predicted DNA binding protein
MTEVASLGGAVQDVVLDGSDLQITIHLPQDVEVRDIVETVRASHDSGEVIARRQVTDRDNRSERLGEVWANELTDRQRTVVETAFYAGFFEWPRVTSAEDVADSLGIAGPTFSQHLRAPERKVFARLVGADPEDDEFTN